MCDALCPLPAGKIDAPALVAGSFDPVTLGHLDLVQRAAELFSPVYLTLFVNAEKKCLFSIDERLSFLRLASLEMPGVRVDAWDGLLADYAREKGIFYVVKGYRDENDLAYERLQAGVNHRNFPALRTVLLPAGKGRRQISSTLVRARLVAGGSLAGLVPAGLEGPILAAYTAKANSKK